MDQQATPNESVLTAGLEMDAVSLRVADLDLMSDYYEKSLALTPIEERSRGREVHRVLGRGATPFVRLIHTPDLPAGSQRDAGLFHTAFLFDDAASLSATVLRSAQDPRAQFVGSSDHLVSEAFYFTDPEGNGIELYVDRPRDQWQYADGDLRMDTVFLDPNAYLQKHLDEDILANVERQSGKVGHVHLQVGDLQVARNFYVNALGLDPTVENYPGALFAAAGGYHHHVAMNTWNSRGAGPRGSQLGLGDLSITLPTRADLDELSDRYRAQQLDFHDTGNSIITQDPWGTQVTVALPGRDAAELLES
ncbi:MAG: VOC family protein [Leucobacter sp.]